MTANRTLSFDDRLKRASGSVRTMPLCSVGELTGSHTSLSRVIIDVGAQCLIFGEVALASVVLIAFFSHWSRLSLLRWLVPAAVMLVLSVAFGTIASGLYYLPPASLPAHMHLDAGHVYGNSFPSHHALLAAAVVALVFLAQPRWSIPFTMITVFIDWALVVGHFHHVIDVVASTILVAIATATGLLIAPPFVRALTFLLPNSRHA
jgi:membrane-associated phospholipid phosphatase